MSTEVSRVGSLRMSCQPWSNRTGGSAVGQWLQVGAVLATLMLVIGISLAETNSRTGGRPSFEELRERAVAGDVDSEYRLAEMLLSIHDGVLVGTSRKQEVKAGLLWLERSYHGGNVKAATRLGQLLANGGGGFFSPDLARAKKLLQVAADAGELEAQFELGRLLVQSGQGGETPAVKRGMRRLQDAAKSGYADAQYFLAWCYEIGQGVKQDSAKSEKWYRRAARSGNAAAAMLLGERTERDRPREALSWYELAAKNGNIDAWLRVGRTMLYGASEGRDAKEGLAWLETRACVGSARAMYELAMAFSGSVPELKDEYKALQWAVLARRGGDLRAKEIERKLRALVPPEDGGRIDEWAASWRPIAVRQDVPPKRVDCLDSAGSSGQ